jgi:hypothetical protein
MEAASIAVVSLFGAAAEVRHLMVRWARKYSAACPARVGAMVLGLIGACCALVLGGGRLLIGATWWRGVAGGVAGSFQEGSPATGEFRRRGRCCTGGLPAAISVDSSIGPIWTDAGELASFT